jgi:hypothetical protein
MTQATDRPHAAGQWGRGGKGHVRSGVREAFGSNKLGHNQRHIRRENAFARDHTSRRLAHLATFSLFHHRFGCDARTLLHPATSPRGA